MTLNVEPLYSIGTKIWPYDVISELVTIYEYSEKFASKKI